MWYSVCMKILIVSDTHGSFYEMKKVIDAHQPIDVLVHCGDVCDDLAQVLGKTNYQVKAVGGNCDMPGAYPKELVFELGDHRVFLVHGHLHGVKSDSKKLIREAKLLGCDIAMYGHTHVPESVMEDGVYVLNPGSLTEPKTRDGRPSYALMIIDDETGRTSCDICYPDMSPLREYP